MPKFNVLSLLAFEVPVETRDFTDPRQPGKTLTLTVKAPEFADELAAEKRADELIGKWMRPTGGKTPPPWPPPPARPIRWSEALCRGLALIETIQCPEDPADLYDAEELALVTERMPTAWAEIVLWVAELKQKIAEASVGNASAAREETSSVPPATGADLTPPSIIKSLTFSGASTNV
jgi:hypothetical protein